MDSYIIRVYRRDMKNAEKFSGIVEIVERGEKKAFSGFDELRKILNPRSTTKEKEKKRKSKA